MTKTIQGTVRGKTIELNEELGLSDGQTVQVQVRPVPDHSAHQNGGGLIRTEGSLADDPYWDEIMEEIYQERKSDTRREIDE